MQKSLSSKLQIYTSLGLGIDFFGSVYHSGRRWRVVRILFSPSCIFYKWRSVTYSCWFSWRSTDGCAFLLHWAQVSVITCSLGEEASWLTLMNTVTRIYKRYWPQVRDQWIVFTKMNNLWDNEDHLLIITRQITLYLCVSHISMSMYILNTKHKKNWVVIKLMQLIRSALWC